MIFQLIWAASSLVFWGLGSQRGLLALAMGTLGLGGSTGIFGVFSSLFAYFLFPDVRGIQLSFTSYAQSPLQFRVLTSLLPETDHFPRTRPQPLPWYFHFFFVWVRPAVIVTTTVFIFAATSHANNGLLRSIEKHERETQVLILGVCSVLYGLSCWMLVSVYTIPSTFLITWTTTTLLLLILLAHGTLGRRKKCNFTEAERPFILVRSLTRVRGSRLLGSQSLQSLQV